MRTLATTIYGCLVLSLGCSRPVHDFPEHDVEAILDPAAYDPHWNDRNADIYRFLLSELDAPYDDVCSITTTPPSLWTDEFVLEAIPQDELKRHQNASLYKSASNVHLNEDECVRENDTGRAASIRWISVRRWNSESEVEIETGTYKGPLAGGGKILIYEKQGDTWKLKSRGFSWVS